MSGAGRLLLGLAAVLALGLGPTATPAQAGVLSTACSLTGLVSGLAGKACTVATHAGRVLSAGKKLLGGHVGGAIDALTGAGSKATRALGLATIALAVAGGARYLLKGAAALISATTRPDLTSSWFSASYWRMAAVSALLTLPFLFAAAIQALIRADLALLLRAAFGYLPVAMLAVAVAVPLTMLLLAASDEMSAIVAAASGHSGAGFLDRIAALGGLGALAARSVFLSFFVGLLAIGVTTTLWIELLIRDAAVYVVVLMLPLMFAAMVWPARRVWAIRSVELLVALILAKFPIVAVLSLGGAALGHTVVPGLGAIFAGITLVLLAACSPWAMLRLLPLHEVAATAASGLRPTPGRVAMTDARAAGGTDAAERAATTDLPELIRSLTEAGSRARTQPDADAAPSTVDVRDPDLARGDPGDAADQAPAAAPDGGTAAADQAPAVAADGDGSYPAGVADAFPGAPEPRGEPLPEVFRPGARWHPFELSSEEDRPLLRDDDPPAPEATPPAADPPPPPSDPPAPVADRSPPAADPPAEDPEP